MARHELFGGAARHFCWAAKQIRVNLLYRRTLPIIIINKSIEFEMDRQTDSLTVARLSHRVDVFDRNVTFLLLLLFVMRLDHHRSRVRFSTNAQCARINFVCIAQAKSKQKQTNLLQNPSSKLVSCQGL